MFSVALYERCYPYISFCLSFFMICKWRENMWVPFNEPQYKYGWSGSTEDTTRDWIPTTEDKETERKELILKDVNHNVFSFVTVCWQIQLFINSHAL